MGLRISIIDYQKILKHSNAQTSEGPAVAGGQKPGQENSKLALSWEQQQMEHKHILRTGL